MNTCPTPPLTKPEGGARRNAGDWSAAEEAIHATQRFQNHRGPAGACHNSIHGFFLIRSPGPADAKAATGKSVSVASEQGILEYVLSREKTGESQLVLGDEQAHLYLKHNLSGTFKHSAKFTSY